MLARAAASFFFYFVSEPICQALSQFQIKSARLPLTAIEGKTLLVGFREASI